MAKRISAGLAWLCAGIVAVLLIVPPARAERAPAVTEWNNSPDPAAPYGGCQAIGPAEDSKLSQLGVFGVSAVNVLAITVLSCGVYDANGSGHQVGITACPAGSPYQLCIWDPNDGRGNSIYLGVLTRGTAANPNEPYQGCPAANRTYSRLRLVEQAGRDPRVINGVVTLSCVAATVSGSQPVTGITCPNGPNPYAYCLGASNDGLGNAVELGVVGANGPGDPYGFYGECGSAAQGISEGMRRKIKIVSDTKQDPGRVVRIDLISCKINQGEPLVPTRALCSAVAPYANPPGRYSYCVWGTDLFHNSFIVGVVTARP